MLVTLVTSARSLSLIFKEQMTFFDISRACERASTPVTWFPSILFLPEPSAEGSESLTALISDH